MVTAGRLQRAKSQRFALGSLPFIPDVEPITCESLSADLASVRHLGIPVSPEEGPAREGLYTQILQLLRRRISQP